MYNTSPNKFAIWFNEKYPGGHRRITADDVRDMTECGLIGRHGFYLRAELGTIMGILQYEEMWAKRSAQESADDRPDLPSCKICGQPLPIEPRDKSGRPKEYCHKCESLRNKERQKKLRDRRRKHCKVATN